MTASGGGSDSDSGSMAGMGMGMTGGPQKALSDDSPFDLPVELLGIVFIYNKPDLRKLDIAASHGAELENATGNATNNNASGG